MNDLTSLARKLRREQTPAERTLWRQLSNRKVMDAKFRRQHPIGDYIVDFVCLERRLVIELDGGHHNDPQAVVADEERTRRLEMAGYRVLRFWNNEIEGNLAGVLESIAQALETE
jgi:very-short-patch-repair endonuclease